MPKFAAASSSGSFFWVHFRNWSGKPEITRWRKHNGPPGGLYNKHANELQNHYFLPVKHVFEHGDEHDSFFTLWETRKPMSLNDISGFFEGPHSPMPHTSYSQVILQVYTTNLACLPDPAFPQGAFIQHAWMPMIEDSMESVASMLDDLKKVAAYDAIKASQDQNEKCAEPESQGDLTHRTMQAVVKQMPFKFNGPSPDRKIVKSIHWSGHERDNVHESTEYSA